MRTNRQRLSRLSNLPVNLCDFLVETEWKFPRDRYIDYGPEDLWWATKYGIGHADERPCRDIVIVKDNIFAHPDTWRNMQEVIRANGMSLIRPNYIPNFGDLEGLRIGLSNPKELFEASCLETFCGLQVTFDSSLTDGVRWEFPYDKFVEYGPEDLWWSVKVNFGKWVPAPNKNVYRIGNRLIVHPETWDAIKKEFEKVTAPITQKVITNG